MPVSSKEFLDIQATIECGFTRKRVLDMVRTNRLNRDAKTSSGVTQYTFSVSSGQKWTMNRSDAAEIKKLCKI